MNTDSKEDQRQTSHPGFLGEAGKLRPPRWFGLRFIVLLGHERWARLIDGGGRLDDRFHLGCLRQSGPRFFQPAPFREDVGKDEILARFIRLPRDGPALNQLGFLKPVLPHIDERDEIQRLRIMNVEPAGMAERGSGLRQTAGLQVKSAQGDRRG